MPSSCLCSSYIRAGFERGSFRSISKTAGFALDKKVAWCLRISYVKKWVPLYWTLRWILLLFWPKNRLNLADFLHFPSQSAEECNRLCHLNNDVWYLIQVGFLWVVYRVRPSVERSLWLVFSLPIVFPFQTEIIISAILPTWLTLIAVYAMLVRDWMVKTKKWAWMLNYEGYCSEDMSSQDWTEEAKRPSDQPTEPLLQVALQSRWGSLTSWFDQPLIALL